VSVPGFDDRLRALLSAEAGEIGETLEVFVSRAVALRLVQSLAARRDPRYGYTVDQLVSAGLLPADPSEPHRRSVLDDPGRLRALDGTGLLSTAPSEPVRRTVTLVAEALSAPSAALCLVDRTRQFFVCGVGTAAGATGSDAVSLDRSIAKYIVASGRPLVIDDTRADDTLMHHPVVVEGSVAAYLGVPLTSTDGFTVGALCGWDSRPRLWSYSHLRLLRDLAEVLRTHIFRTPAG
jgi:GAF domain-containing protein